MDLPLGAREIVRLADALHAAQVSGFTRAPAPAAESALQSVSGDWTPWS